MSKYVSKFACFLGFHKRITTEKFMGFTYEGPLRLVNTEYESHCKACGKDIGWKIRLGSIEYNCK